MKSIIHWKIFFILLVLSLLSVMCVLPYVLTVQKEVLESINIPIGLLVVAQSLQSIILFSIVIFFGLFFTSKIGFQLPLLNAFLEKKHIKKIFREIIGISIVSGILIAIVLYTADFIFGSFGAAISTHAPQAPAWQTLLASFYGGITEEIFLRLFAMSFFIWIGMKVFRQKKPSNSVIIFSILLASILFGLGHLPITASITEINALVVSRAIILNGIAGIVFGWLFWKKGFESGVISHFTADIFLLTILPFIFN